MVFDLIKLIPPKSCTQLYLSILAPYFVNNSLTVISFLLFREFFLPYTIYGTYRGIIADISCIAIGFFIFPKIKSAPTLTSARFRQCKSCIHAVFAVRAAINIFFHTAIDF